MKVKRQLIAITASLTVAIVLVSFPVLCANQQVRAVPAKGTPFGWELGGVGFHTGADTRVRPYIG